MKKSLYNLICITLTSLLFLTSCTNSAPKNNEEALSTNTTPTSNASENAEKVTINIGTIAGPTGLGMVKLMSDQESVISKNNYNFDVVSDPKDMVGKILTGENDICALPTNLASTIYNKSNKEITVLGINTMGMLYILENGNDIKEFSDLKGRTITAAGEGAVPEYVLRYLLEKNNLTVGTDVEIDFKANHTEVSSLLASEKIDLAMLPEPNVTATLMQNTNITTSIDLNTEWHTQTGEDLPLGCVVVRNEFLAKNPEAVKIFMEEYEKSIDYTNNNTEDASILAEKYQIFPKASIVQAAIPTCNISWTSGEAAKTTLTDFYEILFEANPASIGGQVPDAPFYYTN